MAVDHVVPPAGAGVLLRSYAGAGDAEGAQAMRPAVRAADGDLWLPGPDTSDDPAADHPFCLIAEATDAAGDGVGAGQVVGFTWMDWWIEVDGLRVYLLSGTLEPGRRRRGIGGAMLAWQERRATELDPNPGPGPAVFAVNVAPDQPGKLAMLLAAGYRLAFTAMELSYDLSDLPAGDPGPLPGGLIVRPVEEQHHRRIHQVIEECFAESRTGYLSRTHEEYLRDVQDVQVWCVAWDGDDIVAVAVNELQPDGSAHTPWVAVRPAWRRRGIALALMRHSLRTLADRGVPTAIVETTLENPNNSVGLYEKAGYQVVDRQPRYRKPVPGQLLAHDPLSRADG